MSLLSSSLSNDTVLTPYAVCILLQVASAALLLAPILSKAIVANAEEAAVAARPAGWYHHKISSSLTSWKIFLNPS